MAGNNVVHVVNSWQGYCGCFLLNDSLVNVDGARIDPLVQPSYLPNIGPPQELVEHGAPVTPRVLAPRSSAVGDKLFMAWNIFAVGGLFHLPDLNEDGSYRAKHICSLQHVPTPPTTCPTSFEYRVTSAASMYLPRPEQRQFPAISSGLQVTMVALQDSSPCFSHHHLYRHSQPCWHQPKAHSPHQDHGGDVHHRSDDSFTPMATGTHTLVHDPTTRIVNRYMGVPVLPRKIIAEVVLLLL